MTDWQPIETVPNNEQVVVYCRRTGYSIGFWNQAIGRWIGIDYASVDTVEMNSVKGAPTHWLPLPDPPRRRKLGGRHD